MNLELLPTDGGSALNAVVRLEAGNWKAVGTAYAEAAAHLADLFSAGDHGAVHLYLCDAQDRTTDPAVWNRVMQALARNPHNALAALPTPLKLVSVRDFRPTHRKTAALFRIETAESVKNERKAIEQRAAEQAAAIEQRAAAERAAEQTAADAAITERDIFAAALAEIDRLNLSRATFYRLAADMAAETAAETAAA